MEDRVDLKFIRVNGSGEIEGLFKYDTIVKTRCIYGIETRVWVLKRYVLQRRSFKFLHSLFGKSFLQNGNPSRIILGSHTGEILYRSLSRDIFFFLNLLDNRVEIFNNQMIE